MTCPRDKTPSDDENNAPDSPSQPPQQQGFDLDLIHLILDIQNQCQLPTPCFVRPSDSPEEVNEFIKSAKNFLQTLGMSIFEQLGRCDPITTGEQHETLRTLLHGFVAIGIVSGRTSLKRAAENNENPIPTKKFSQKETVDEFIQRLSSATHESKLIRKEVDSMMNCDAPNRPSASGIPPIRPVENPVNNELPGPIRRQIKLQTDVFKTDDCLTVEKLDGKDVAQSSRLSFFEHSSPGVASSDSPPSFKNYGDCGLKCVRSFVKCPNQPSTSKIPPTKLAMNPFKTENPGNHTSGKKGEFTSSDVHSFNRSPKMKAIGSELCMRANLGNMSSMSDSPQRSSKKSSLVRSRKSHDSSKENEAIMKIITECKREFEAQESLKSTGNEPENLNSGIPVIKNSLISSNLTENLNLTETARIESENIQKRGNKQNRYSKTSDDVKSSKNNRQDTTESSTSKVLHVDPYSPYPHLDYIHRLTSSDSGLLEQTSTEKTENPGNLLIGNERESTSSDDRVFKKNPKMKATGSPQRSSKKPSLVRSRKSHHNSKEYEVVMKKIEAYKREFREAQERLKSSENILKDPNQPSTSEVAQVGSVGNSVVNNSLIPSNLKKDLNSTETGRYESENIPKRGNKQNRNSLTPDDVKSSKNILKDPN